MESTQRGAVTLRHITYFRKIPKNILNFDVSSGGFSAACCCVKSGDSSAVEAVVEAAGECSEDPDDSVAILMCTVMVLWNYVTDLEK